MNESIEITTLVGCANACHFCPQKTLVTNYPAGAERVMSMETFQACLNKLPSHVEVHFSGFAEPFFNPLCGEMIAWAVKVGGFKVHLYTTCMGFKESDITKLIFGSPEYIRIHVPDQTGLRLDDDAWIAQHNLIRQTGLPMTYMAMGAMTPKVADYMHSLGLTVELPPMLSRGGNIAHIPARKITGELRCGMNRWHNNVLLPNGNVQACCMDYGCSIRLGNLLWDDYHTIWNHAETHSKNFNPPQNSICRSCEWAAAI